MTRRSPWFVAGVIVVGIVLFIAIGFARYWYLGGGAEGFERASELTHTDEQIANYEAAKRAGKAPLACVLAMNISASYFSLREEDLYQHWREIRDADCASVPGMPPPARRSGAASP